jgi:PTH1 family peptidyl-tRNA hydrolase
LGNPGEKYYLNRHNVGFRIVDRIAALLNIKIMKPFLTSRYLLGKGRYRGKDIALVKPLTFMNRSGEVVRHVLKKTHATLKNLLIVCDNLDLEPGSCKFKLQGSSGGHNGLESIFSHIKTNAVMRITVGIGKPKYKTQVIDYVLNDPPLPERKLIDETEERIISAILQLLNEPPQKVMNVINKKSRTNSDSKNS